jgi:cation:H+ antiporter
MAALPYLGLVLVACIGIMYSCNVFEPAADHLGRNMKEGVKGATINAVGSSLPELFTTLILLFAYNDLDGLSGGVATTAGSAVFNAVLIPGGAILAVTMMAKLTSSVEISRKVLLRDGFFVLLAEIVLITFLGFEELTWWMGAVLMWIYIVYFAVLMKTGGGLEEDDDEDDEDDEEPESRGIVGDFFTAMKGDDIPLTDGVAWLFLSVSIAMVGAFCFLLSEATVKLAEIWHVPLFITTVVFAAAATSVPDTILSVKDALKGNYDDAVANAVGSNIFDVCVSLGLPLTLYCLVTGGPVALQQDASGADIQVLRWVMLGFTAVVIGLFSLGAVGKKTGMTMVAMYAGWLGYIGYTVYTM